MGGWSSSGTVTTTNDIIGIGTQSPKSSLEIQLSAVGGLGPTLTLTNTGGEANAASAVDLNTFASPGGGGYNPSSRIEAVDMANFANDIVFSTNKPGAQNNGLVERMRIDGQLGGVRIPGALAVSGQGWNSLQRGISTGAIAMGDPAVQGTMVVSGAEGKIYVIDSLTMNKIGPNNPYSPPAGFNLVSWAPNALGPTMTLTNLGGGAQAAAAIDFTTSSPAGSAPTTARIMATDNGNGTSSLTFLTPGAPNGGLLPSMVITADGKVGIGTPPTSRLHVAGDISVTGDVLLTGADCAEHFDVVGDEPLEPGTVVVIDEDGALRKSRDPYDKKVAGIVSGAGDYRHGIVLDKRSSEAPRVPIALVGKVYCKVDAEYSPIEVGDLLTTSPTEGHAMKATNAPKAFGCVLGKALKSFDGGRGMIPVLVALQ